MGSEYPETEPRDAHVMSRVRVQEIPDISR